MGQGIDLLFDDWGLSSLASAIILREIMGYNITLSTFNYAHTIDIIINSSYIASSLEIYPNYLNQEQIDKYSIDNQLFTDQQLGVQSFTSWFIPNSFIEHINNVSSPSNEIWLDFWKTYTSKTITDELFKANQLNLLNFTRNVCIPPLSHLSSQLIPCDFAVYHSQAQHSWNPTECNHDDCNILILNDLHYDQSLNSQIIKEQNLSFILEYLENNDDRNNIIDRNEFVLYSFSEPSSIVSSNKFTRISLPSQYQLSQATLIHKYIPNVLDIVSSFAYEFLQSLKMDNSDYSQIYESIINDIGIDNVFSENTDDRLNHVCQWLQSEENIKKWSSWIPDISEYSSDSINCGLYSDEELTNLRYLNDYIDDDNEELYYRIESKQIAIELYDKQSSFPDLWTAIRVNQKCVSHASNYPNSLLAMQIVAGVLIFFILICFVLTVWSRREVIIIAASYPLLISFLFGAIVGCLVPIFGYPSAEFYIAEVLCVHTCIIVMFGSLIGKSWRLHKIIQNARKGKTTDITTKHIFLRLGIVCCAMYIYWIIVAIFFGDINVGYEIVDGVEYLRVTMENDNLLTAILLLAEFCGILWGARLAWSLRSVNPQFNESKHIAIILYHTFFVATLIVIFFILNINPHFVRALWMFVWLIMIAFAVTVLMIPKFRAIWFGVEYIDKGTNI